MKLERIEVRRLGLKLRTPFETSFGRTTSKEFLLVSVSADGVTGHAECVADVDPFYLPETNATVLHVLRDFLAPLAFALEIGHPREVLARLRARARARDGEGGARDGGVGAVGAPRAAAALARAGRPRRLHRVRRLGGPAARRGGARRSGRRARWRPATGASRSRSSRAATWRSSRRCAKRFPELPLMVDANSAYTLADAEHLAALDRFCLMMIEQPLGWDDIVDHATLQKRLATPVCLDESIHGAEDARRALELGACQIVNIKVGRVGGFASAIARPRRVPRALALPSGAAACSSRGSAASRTCTCRRCPASRCRATPPRASATSRRTSSTRPSSSRRRARSRCRRAPASATRSSGRGSSARATSTRRWRRP